MIGEKKRGKTRLNFHKVSDLKKIMDILYLHEKINGLCILKYMGFSLRILIDSNSLLISDL